MPSEHYLKASNLVSLQKAKVSEFRTNQSATVLAPGLGMSAAASLGSRQPSRDSASTMYKHNINTVDKAPLDETQRDNEMAVHSEYCTPPSSSQSPRDDKIIHNLLLTDKQPQGIPRVAASLSILPIYSTGGAASQTIEFLQSPRNDDIKRNILKKYNRIPVKHKERRKR